jgi:hypothetical protein
MSETALETLLNRSACNVLRLSIDYLLAIMNFMDHFNWFVSLYIFPIEDLMSNYLIGHIAFFFKLRFLSQALLFIGNKVRQVRAKNINDFGSQRKNTTPEAEVSNKSNCTVFTPTMSIALNYTNAPTHVFCCLRQIIIL